MIFSSVLSKFGDINSWFSVFILSSWIASNSQRFDNSIVVKCMYCWVYVLLMYLLKNYKQWWFVYLSYLFIKNYKQWWVPLWLSICCVCVCMSYSPTLYCPLVLILFKHRLFSNNSNQINGSSSLITFFFLSYNCSCWNFFSPSHF